MGLRHIYASLSTGELFSIREVSKYHDTDMITDNEKPHVTSLLSVFINTKPGDSYFEKPVRFAKFFKSEGGLIGLNLNQINQYRPWRLGCTYKFEKGVQISTVTRGNIPKCTRKARLLKFCRSTPRQSANTNRQNSQLLYKIFIEYWTMECHTIIITGNPISSKFKQHLQIFTHRVWHA